MRKFYLTAVLAMLFVLNTASATDSNLPSNSNSFLVPLGNPEFLYFHCDAGNRLYKMKKSDNVISYIGVTTGYVNIETITYNGFDDKLYGIHSGSFLEISKSNAAVSNVIDIDGGTALNGSVGSIWASDVDALAFDAWTGDYWAAARRNGTFDALFKIDASTGQVIRDAFGAGIDYIIIDGVGVNIDIDDIAIDPTTGKLYAVTTVSGSSKLVEINRFTGSLVSSVEMDQADAEGLDFTSDGVLYATLGVDNELWIVDLNGTMTNMVDLTDGGACGDVESITATTAPADTLGGKIWDDTDMSGGINGVEVGIAGVTVQLIYDNDGDGQIDTDDAILQTAVTDANGDYGFQFATNANLIINIDETTLPTSYGMTTDNIETASFVDVNNVEQDYNNDFGAVSGADCDGDGIPDFVEGFNDSDNDSINDNCDLDSDNDGILDAVEGMVDTDGDGIFDLVDRDSDNDGIPDAIEANGGIAPMGYVAAFGNIIDTDSDNDGLVDSVDDLPMTSYGASTSLIPNIDHDHDGIIDYVDLDSDNDGILDVIEAGGTDTNNDGKQDSFNDPDLDGYSDALTTTPLPVGDLDQSGSPNYLDLDADDDGILDNTEGQNASAYTYPGVFLDNDNDGIIDFWDIDFGGAPVNPINTDGTGNEDYLDIDADNDGIPDIVEAGGTDTDGDGHVDYPTAGDPSTMVDLDNDGLADTYDDEDTEGSTVGWVDGTPILNPDSDADGINDALDIDADNDGIPDIIEAGGTDTNGDGLVDTPTDSDNDGLVDTYDPSNETSPGNNEGTEHFVTGADSGNGTPSIPCTDCDSDKDGNPDHLDLDADNDGLPDIVEAGGIDVNGDGQVDVPTDSDDDGYADVVDPSNEENAGVNEGTEYFVTGADSGDGTPSIMCTDCDNDKDGNPDHLDLDADNDGIPDVIEAGGIDTNGDGQVDTNTDTDGDGLADVYDTDDNTISGTGDGGTALVATDGSGNMIDGATSASIDTDSDGKADHLDIDADNDGITDIAEVGGDDPNGSGMVDTGLVPWDVDGDGLADVYDTDNNTSPGTGDGASDALVITSADSGTNGHVDGADEMQAGGASVFTTINEDSSDEVVGIPSLPNQLDIDADNDGIVDNSEAQATNAYTAPTGYDDDNDGLDNAYDPDCTGACINSDGVTTDVTGIPMVLENTDMTDSPDWLDTDTDNDGISDIDEAGAGVDPMATPEDLDGDGLIWDDATATAVSPDDPTNTNDQPATFDDLEDPGTDRDWRHGPCALCKVIYGVQDGAGTQTSAFNYNESTQVLETTTDVFGTIRTSKYCLIDGWRYYYNPAAPTQALFAVRGDSLDLDKIDYIDITVGETASDREAGLASDAYSRLMNRDWYVEMSAALTNPVDIRFYLPGDDFGANGFQAADTEADNYALTGTPDYKWFQVPAWDVFDPTTIDADAANLTGMAGFEVLDPVVAANTSTGLAAADGNGTTVGDGKNFVQFDGLTALAGGTAGYGVGASALPVELNSFQAIVEGCSIDLNWITEGEINFSHYEVEWSGDGRSFQKMKTVKGSGMTSLQSYSITDDNGADDNYYRLKMIDLDGTHTYSRVIHAKTDCLENFKLKLYPNPILKEDGQLSVKFFAQKESASLVITDMFGRTARSVELDASNREWSKSVLDISDLSAGTYNLRVVGQRRSQIFVIAN